MNETVAIYATWGGSIASIILTILGVRYKSAPVILVSVLMTSLEWYAGSTLSIIAILVGLGQIIYALNLWLPDDWKK